MSRLKPPARRHQHDWDLIVVAETPVRAPVLVGFSPSLTNNLRVRWQGIFLVVADAGCVAPDIMMVKERECFSGRPIKNKAGIQVQVAAL